MNSENDVKKRQTDLQIAQERLASYLHQHHLRHTPERRAMVETIFSLHGHFTVEDLANALLKRHFYISPATLYNNMDILTEVQIIDKHYFGSTVRYERRIGIQPHMHRVCRKCGTVWDYTDEKLMRKFQETSVRGFYIDYNYLYIYGICGKCRSAQRKKELKLANNES